jgi:hypothetical protein
MKLTGVTVALQLQSVQCMKRFHRERLTRIPTCYLRTRFINLLTIDTNEYEKYIVFNVRSNPVVVSFV